MPIIASRVNELLNLYLQGMSIDDMAERMRVKSADVKDFLPKGDEGLAYEKVIESRQQVNVIESGFEHTKASIRSLVNSNNRLVESLNTYNSLIRDFEAELKLQKETRGRIANRVNEVKEMRAQLIEIRDDQERALIKIREDHQVHVDAKNEIVAYNKIELDKAAKRMALIKKAEQVTKEAIILASVQAAKDIVAGNVDSILAKREKANGSD